MGRVAPCSRTELLCPRLGGNRAASTRHQQRLRTPAFIHPRANDYNTLSSSTSSAALPRSLQRRRPHPLKLAVPELLLVLHIRRRDRRLQRRGRDGRGRQPCAVVRLAVEARQVAARDEGRDEGRHGRWRGEGRRRGGGGVGGREEGLGERGGGVGGAEVLADNESLCAEEERVSDLGEGVF